MNYKGIENDGKRRIDIKSNYRLNRTPFYPFFRRVKYALSQLLYSRYVCNRRKLSNAYEGG